MNLLPSMAGITPHVSRPLLGLLFILFSAPAASVGFSEGFEKPVVANFPETNGYWLNYGINTYGKIGSEASRALTFIGDSGKTWTVDSGNVDVCSNLEWAASAGHQSLNLNGWEPGSVYTDLALPRGSYMLSVDYARHPDDSLASTSFSILLNGIPLPGSPKNAEQSVNQGWRTYRAFLTIDSGSPQILRLSSVTSYSPAAGIVIDNLRVTKLSGLRASSAGPLAISLSWISGTPELTGFRIESKAGSCRSDGAWEVLADTDPGVTDLDYGGLTPATERAFRLLGRFQNDEVLLLSECTSARTGLNGTPRTPVDIRASSIASNTVALSWDDTSNNETSFRIFRKAGAGNWTLLQTVAANSRSYSDATASGNRNSTRYTYDVRACNAAGCSRANPAPELPFTPTNLSITTSAPPGLQWTDTSTGETGFQVQRKNGTCASTNPWVLMTASRIGEDATTFEDGSVVPGTTYSYRVRAYGEVGSPPNLSASAFSTWSGCVSASAQ